MKCPVCVGAELIQDTRDLSYTYKGEGVVIAAVTGDYCPACNEVILDNIDGDRYMKLIKLHMDRVDSITK